jgi:chemotaxis protein methyltransferase CheR
MMQTTRTVTVASAHAESTHLALDEISDEELTEVGTILNMWRNFNMSVYKDKCMKRRVAIRIRYTRCRDVAEYCNLLRRSEHELDMLQKTLTIHVSQFFRNPSMFEKLRTQVLPELFKSCIRNQQSPMRIWCLGCAGGEEPYSLTILLREHFSPEMRSVPVVIKGTDIDEGTIRTAEQAEYLEDRIKELPAGARDRYFRQDGGRFRLVPELRNMVTFQKGNITSMAEYEPANLVLCRNTLIYFTRPDQEKILRGITDILPEGGILVLGKSETLVGDVRRRFTSLCPVERIYRKLEE